MPRPSLGESQSVPLREVRRIAPSGLVNALRTLSQRGYPVRLICRQQQEEYTGEGDAKRRRNTGFDAAVVQRTGVGTELALVGAGHRAHGVLQGPGNRWPVIATDCR